MISSALMASCIRISALINRHLLLTFRTIDRTLNIFYWPLITLIVWGGNMVWMGQQAVQGSSVEAVFFAMILWQVTYRVSLEIANSLMEELLSKNLTNLFSTPVTIYEWTIAISVLGILNMFLIGAFGSSMLYLIFGINMLSLGWMLPLLLFALLIAGLAIGFVICAIFITWGRAVRDFMHALVWLIGVFSAMYYPVAVMPDSMQHIASLLPTAAIFEALRGFVTTGVIEQAFVTKGIILNGVYLLLSIVLFVMAFHRSKDQGLGRLE